MPAVAYPSVAVTRSTLASRSADHVRLSDIKPQFTCETQQLPKIDAPTAWNDR